MLYWKATKSGFSYSSGSGSGGIASLETVSGGTEIPYDCGNILHNAANGTKLLPGWNLGCYMGQGDEV